MKLHFETVSPMLVEILQRIMASPVFDDFVLIGGTCLSLQLGHRRSIDIDLFTDMDYGMMDTQNMKVFLKENFAYVEKLDSLDTPAMGYSLYVGNSAAEKVKLDFFYTEKFIFPIKVIDNIRFADIREIAAMKMGAITQDIPRQKDFWDIHELSEKYSMEEMIGWAVKRNEWALSEADIIKGFHKMNSVKESVEGIDCFRGKYWSLVKDDLHEMMDEYIRSKR